MGIAHFPFEFRPRHQGRDGIDHDHVDRAGAHQRVGNFQRLFAGIGLRNQQFLYIDMQLAGIDRIKRVFRVDKGAGAALFLGFGHDMQRQGRLAGTFRAVNLDDAALRHAADPERDIEPDRARGDGFGIGRRRAFAQLHDRALAVRPFDLAQRGFERLRFVVCGSVHDIPVDHSEVGIGHNALLLIPYGLCRRNRRSDQMSVTKCTAFVLVCKNEFNKLKTRCFYG